MPTEPFVPTGPAAVAASGATPAGYLSGEHAALPVQLTPSVGHLAAVAHPAAAARPAAVGHSTAVDQPAAAAPSVPRQALVVQTAPPDPAPAEIAEPAQDLTPDLGADAPGGQDIPSQAPSAAPAGTLPAGAPAAGAAAGAAAAASNPDELVKKLFDPLLRRLKTELRLDRERRGMLTDLRH